jgi:hypothetical protein
MLESMKDSLPMIQIFIDENYLIAHTLQCMDRWSSDNNRDDIVAFQNLAWEKSHKLYDVLAGREWAYKPSVLEPDNLRNLGNELIEYLEFLKKSEEFKKVFNQVELY